MRVYLLFIIILFSFQTILVLAETEVEEDLLFDKGLELMMNYKFEESISYFDKILEIDPNHVGALNNKAVALDKLGKFEEAISLYDKLIEINPNDVNVLYNIGAILYSNEKSYEAISYLAKAVEIEPNNDNAKNLLSDAVNSSTTKFKKIESVFEVLVRDSEGNLVTYYTINNFKVIEHEFFEKKIKQAFDKKIITLNNQEVDVLQYKSHLTSPGTMYRGSFGLALPGNLDLWLTFTRAPQIPIAEGDSMELVYTIFDPSYIF